MIFYFNTRLVIDIKNFRIITKIYDLSLSFNLTQKIIAKLACQDYGFGCSFETKEEEIKKVIEAFREHTFQEHHIDYHEGILMKFIMRKKVKIDTKSLKKP